MTAQGSTLMYTALCHGCTRPLRLHPKPKVGAMAGDSSGWNYLALHSGHVEVAQLLVEHGADTTAQDQDGWTPLHFVSQNGHVEIVWFLVECGADLTAWNKAGFTPLDLASVRGHIETVQFLLENGKDPVAVRWQTASHLTQALRDTTHCLTARAGNVLSNMHHHTQRTLISGAIDPASVAPCDLRAQHSYHKQSALH